MSEPATQSPEVQKALLLCAHVAELSEQCRVALRHGSYEILRDSQASKDARIAELTALARLALVAESAEVQRAVLSLRVMLQAEADLVAETTRAVENDLQNVRAEQKRLTQLRHYDSATQALATSVAGQLSARG